MTGPEHDGRGSNPLVRLLDWLGEFLRLPSDETPDDPLLTGIEDLPPEQQSARRRIWWGQFRRGRDG